MKRDHREHRVVKTIDLTPAEAREIRRSFRKLAEVEGILTDMIMELAEKRAEQRESIWDTVSRKAGFNSTADAEDKGYTMQVDYATCKLQLKAVPGGPADKPGESDRIWLVKPVEGYHVASAGTITAVLEDGKAFSVLMDPKQAGELPSTITVPADSLVRAEER